MQASSAFLVGFCVLTTGCMFKGLHYLLFLLLLKMTLKSDCQEVQAIALDEIFLDAQQREWMSHWSGSRDHSPVLPL